MANFYGTSGRDFIDGTDEDNLIRGNWGDDILKGWGGNDTIHGGRGKDVLRGHTGDDILKGELDDDRLFGGRGEDQLWGGQGADIIDGGADDDELFGGPGNDILIGGEGRDILTGGSGSDQFVFNLDSGTNRIKDFDADDKLSVDGPLVEAQFWTFNDDTGDVLFQFGDTFVRVEGTDEGEFAIGAHQFDGFTVAGGLEAWYEAVA